MAARRKSAAAAVVEGVLVRQWRRPAPLQERSPQTIAVVIVIATISARAGAACTCDVVVAHFGKEMLGRGAGGGGGAGAEVALGHLIVCYNMYVDGATPRRL